MITDQKRKGLNVPTIVRETELDKAFSELSTFLEIEEDTKEDALTHLSNKICCTQSSDESSKISELSKTCFSLMDKIQDLSISKQEQQAKNPTDTEKSNLISISLHDMNHLNNLLNVIISQVIYPCLPPGFGIPLNQRRLNSFTKEKKVFRFKQIRNTPQALAILKSVVDRFQTIFSKKGDLRDLLIKGSGLTDIVTVLIVLIHSEPSSKQQTIQTLELFESYSDSYNLFGIYITLLQTTGNISSLKSFLVERLTLTLINRPNGLVSLIDFIMGIRDDEDINIERFNQVNMILMSKPKYITSVEYYTKLFSQIYDVLVFINRPVLVSSVTNYLRVLYDRNKRIVQDFLFKRIRSTLVPKSKSSSEDLIVSGKQLNDVVNVLISLTKETSPDFLLDLFKNDIIVALWVYYFYLSKRNAEYKKIIQTVMISYFTTTSDNQGLQFIILNLAKSKLDTGKFKTDLETSLTSIVKSNSFDDQNITNDGIFDDIDLGLKIVMELLKELPQDMVRAQFIIVLNRWILSNQKLNDQIKDEGTNPFMMLIDLKFVDLVNAEFKDMLMEKPLDLLVVIQNLLQTKMMESKNDEVESTEVPDSDDEDSDDEDERKPDGGLSILFELLSAIISESDMSELAKQTDILKEISKILLTFQGNPQCLSLSTRITELLTESKDKITPKATQYEEDKSLMKSAINNLNDPLVPIRAHGLYQLRQLIQRKSEVITLDFVINLHFVQLKDQDPFIYLNVVKSLIDMINFDEDGTIRILISLYRNEDGKEDLEERLKIGEVLLNYITNTNELLHGELVDMLISTLMIIIRDSEGQDNKIRMSSMSLLGHSLRINALALQIHISDALDMAIGILEFEKDATMLRSAIVLISDLIAFGGLEIIPRGYAKKIQTLMGFVRANNYEDLLLVEMIDKVVGIVEDLIKDKFKIEETDLFSSLKIVK